MTLFPPPSPQHQPRLEVDWDVFVLPGIVGVFVLLALGMLYLHTEASRDCARRGGVLVRADIWYTCARPACGAPAPACDGNTAWRD